MCETTDHTFDHLISLGPDCAMAYNLRRYFGLDRAFPFDWWVTKDQKGLAQVLREMDVEKIYDPSKLALSEDRRMIVNQELGIQLYHDFPRMSQAPSATIVETFREYIESAKMRCAYLFNRLEKLNSPGTRLLFLRATPSSSIIEDAVRSRFGPGSCGAVVFLGAIKRSDHDWRGDPASWDQALGSLGIQVRIDSRDKRVDSADLN